VLNNAVSDVIFAIFWIQFFVESSSPMRDERKKKTEKKMSGSNSITSILFCLLFITNLSSIRSFSFRGHCESEKRVGRARWKKLVNARIASAFFTNQRSGNEIRWRSDFINSYMSRRDRKTFNRLCKIFVNNVIPFNMIECCDASA